MRKKQMTVSVRITLKARNRLKILAIKNGQTFLEVVDSLLTHKA